jgi:ribonuclease HI
MKNIGVFLRKARTEIRICVSSYTKRGHATVATLINDASREEIFKRMPDESNHKAQYRVLASELSDVPEGSRVRISSDSKIVWRQLGQGRRAKAPELEDLLLGLRGVIESSRLTVTLSWIARHQNPARKLIDYRRTLRDWQTRIGSSRTGNRHGRQRVATHPDFSKRLP